MEAGRELDALIAENVMGWKRPKWTVTRTLGDCMIPPAGADLAKLTGTGHRDFEGDKEDIYWTPHYSTDIAAAWGVVEKLESLGFLFSVSKGRMSFYGGEGVWASFGKLYDRIESTPGETPAHAICLAALKAVGDGVS